MLRRNFIKGLLFTPIALLLSKKVDAQIAEKGMNIIEAFNEASKTSGIIRPVGSENLFYIKTIYHSDTDKTISRKVLSSCKPDENQGACHCELNNNFLNIKWEVVSNEELP